MKSAKTNRMVIFVPHKDKLHTNVSQKRIMSPGLPSIQEVPKTNKPPKPFLCQRPGKEEAGGKTPSTQRPWKRRLQKPINVASFAVKVMWWWLLPFDPGDMQLRWLVAYCLFSHLGGLPMARSHHRGPLGPSFGLGCQTSKCNVGRHLNPERLRAPAESDGDGSVRGLQRPADCAVFAGRVLPTCGILCKKRRIDFFTCNDVYNEGGQGTY